MFDDILSLKKNEASILLIEERKRTDIVIGAPHHTVGGEENMPCDEHKPGDENTGFIARELAIQLDASSLIACNYRIDPNKIMSTDYARQVTKWAPKYLIEIHGHGGSGGKKPDKLTVEVSSGSLSENQKSIGFARVLKSVFLNNEELKNYKVCGNFPLIYFQATTSDTITHNAWTSFHIEFPPSLRKNAEDKLPSFMKELVDCLVKTILEVCK